mgnify:CR=1 FL=1
MDFMLEEEMIDILTFCLQNPNSDQVNSKKFRLKEIGKAIFKSKDTWMVLDNSGYFSKHIN